MRVHGRVGFFLGLLCLAQGGKIAIAGVEVSGFGSAAGVKTSSDYYLSNYGTTGQDVDTSRLTRLGVNMYSMLDPDWLVAAQFVASGRSARFTDTLEFGFISWSPMSEISVRAGRVVAPTWLYSQRINVGFSYIWVSPPEEVYSLNPLGSLNGASILTKTKLGSGVLQGEFFMGEGQYRRGVERVGSSTSFDFDVRGAFGTEISYDYDQKFLLRGGYVRTRATSESIARATLPAGTFPGVNVPTYLVAANPLSVGMSQLFSAGIKFDHRNILFSTEVARRIIEGTAVSAASGFYAMAGYRWGRFTPYLTYSWQGAFSGTMNLHPNFPTVTSTQKSGHSDIVGLNYQPTDFVILKSEYSRSYMHFHRSADDLSFNVYRLAVDFVF